MKEKTKIRIIIIELILALFLMIPIFLNNYTFFFLIVSNSMNPLIYKNDIVLVRNSKNNLKDYVGKVVAYYNPINSSIMVHRAVGKNDDFLLTKGDNSSWIDFYVVPENRVIGDVVFVIKTSKIFK